MSHAHAFVFLKTRKTAGTTIEMALEPLCRPPGAAVTETTPMRLSEHGIVGRRLSPLSTRDRAAAIDWRNHMPAAEVRDALGADRWRRYRKVTAVRDPFDAAVSRFHWEQERRGLAEADDFAETRRRFRALVTDRVRAADFDGGYDIVHIDGAFAADRVIRYEHLAADLRDVMTECAPDHDPPPLAHAKHTAGRRRRRVADYYDAASIAAVRAAAAWLFDRFGYPDSPVPGAPARVLQSEASR